MRYDWNHKQRTRRRIVEAAARRFRVSGYRAAGVDQVMKDAGLTAGGFYAHFSSKETLLAETLGLSLEEVRTQLLGGLDGLEGVAWMQAVARRYLSRAHRDQPGAGCPLPTLGGEIAREGEEPRLALQSYLQQIVAELAPKAPAGPGLDPEDRVLATAALFTGALMLARAVPDEALSDRILRVARRLAVPEMDPYPLPPLDPQ
jgi:TetR/AcrR family transcriptional repressor of nem operon